MKADKLATQRAYALTGRGGALDPAITALALWAAAESGWLAVTPIVG